MLCLRACPRASRARRPAFTLIELLVVVGIIALLVGLLLPALHRARRQAHKTVVLAQLQQIGQAVTNYTLEFRGAFPTNLDDDQDGRALFGLALLAGRYKLAAELFVNPNTNDTPAKASNADGWPIFLDIDGVEVTTSAPAAIDASNIASVNWHCSFAYDHERKRTGRRSPPRVYLGDRGDYAHGRSFSGNWDDEGMCLLWTDQHAEFVRSKTVQEQADPNVYRHNEYAGEGGDEAVDGVAVTVDTRDTHLRVFSEAEDDALLPNP